MQQIPIAKIFFWGKCRLVGDRDLVIFSFNFSKKWYSESIKTKEEIRSQIFEEMRNNGKDFYEIELVNQLNINIEIINKRIKKTERSR